MKIYIDTNYMCHAETAEGRREFDVPFFDGKCSAFINGHRYVPSGETWTRADGVEFTGEMIAPATDYTMLAFAQAAYEEASIPLSIIDGSTPINEPEESEAES